MKPLKLSILTALAAAFISTSMASAQTARAVDVATMRATINAAANIIENRYVYPEKARQIAAALRDDAANGSISIQDPHAFANALTQRLRALSMDSHFGVEHDVPFVSDEFGK